MTLPDGDLPRHAMLDTFERRDGELVIGGLVVSDIASLVGQTPFYAYSRAHVTQRVRQLRQVLPAGIRLHYAVKANPHPPLVQHLASLTDGLDVASRREMCVALESGMPAAQISFAGPGKTDAELLAAVVAGVTLHVESIAEVRRLADLAQRSGHTPRIAARLNPDFRMRRSGMVMGGGSQPFGIDVEQLPALVDEMRSLTLPLLGFHVYCGSQNLSAERLIDTQNQCIDLLLRAVEQAGISPELLNIGGGFGIPYFPGDRPLELDAMAANLDRRLIEIRHACSEAAVVIELGRYLTGEAGVYVTRVIDRKVSRGQTYLVVDGGMHHHLAASGNFGQVVRRNYPVVAASRLPTPTTETASVVGPLCTPLDVLADQIALPRLMPGDLVAVLQSGAYGPTASPQAFLSHGRSAEILL